ncbi:ATP-dependent DNA helicase [Tessaracoccus sp. SD287]|uniref:ATP-dependent DNA helicase n=1 Tax=Tessaracoccus sp. SD287 TaxID=2782008 RepID=UPI001A964FCB|nr:ATP-dependent DNA helicase [Tessaracoccus sp. SD287]MBO1029846.1 ATP-dependent DNA helicase [Tessaracoccus sp. SD287]
MADAVAATLETGTHSLIQAGTGTGKSLGYLTPALTHLANGGDRIVIATATLALQAQLAYKDIPAALDSVEKVTGTRPTAAILKGRTNYACLYKVRDGPADDQQALLGGAELAAATRNSDRTSAVGAEVLMLREWVEEQAKAKQLGDRDDAPAHTPAAWQQVSIPVRECLGTQRCPYGAECLVEASRERARNADLVVTNHALLAINAMHGGTVLPEHHAVIVDEAHDLVSRVTGAASAELSPPLIERVARRALPWLSDDVGVDLLESADALERGLGDSPLVRITEDGPAVQAFAVVRDAARRALSEMSSKGGGQQPAATVRGDDAEKSQASAAVKEIFDVAERMAALGTHDVVWVSERERSGRWAHVAPLSVAGLMRDKVFGTTPTVLTSATMTVGGEFENIAASVGLSRKERVGDPSVEVEGDEGQWAWAGIDVGSPFDYRKQGILYVAAGLPNPSRDGMAPELLTEIAELVWAAGGRTLGLFASQRNAVEAANHVREQLPQLRILCQGDAQLSELTSQFVADAETSLFGTLSLWQGIDVPGDTCELVIMDKIPFPRPDDPLMQARQQAVAQAGGNGFMSVAAAHAGLLLAQGSGRLIRRSTDRGVVAVLDPRLVTARYGGFLRSSLPEYWMTTDREIAVQALKRLQESRG